MQTRWRLFRPFLLLGLCFALPQFAVASPQQDLQSFQSFFKSQFPQLQLNEFAHGINAINDDAHMQWLSFEDFPPYEEAIEQGKQLFNKRFANGHGYYDCFPNHSTGIRQHFPRYNPSLGEVETLEVALNHCRGQHGEPHLKYNGGEMLSLTAYLAYLSRGQPTQVEVPNEPGALAAYESGKRYYYSKRGQLNMSCAGCHVRGANTQLRGELTSPSLGHTTHFPVYRLTWQSLGSLHRRFAGCNRQVRSVPLPLQSQHYRELEYFLTFMSNGIELNGPSVRQ